MSALRAIRSEWVKFRTVRGWVIGMVLAGLLAILFTYLSTNGGETGFCTGPGEGGAGPAAAQPTCRTGHPFVPTGPDGEAVADSYRFVSGPLRGDGTIVARVTSLAGVTSTNPANVAPSAADTRPGLADWAKAGILLTADERQGSPCAAVMATGAHGVRWQYDYTHDSPGLSGPVSTAAPRWLRLKRRGNTVVGYDSSDGIDWEKIGTAELADLPGTVDVGMFVTSPVSFAGSGAGAATRATARFDHVTVDGDPPRGWHGRTVGARDFYPVLGPSDDTQVGGSYVLTGSGDIAPAVVQGMLGHDTVAGGLLFGLVVALLVTVVVGCSFVSGEYRRGLIRSTFAAMPARGRLPFAKAVVIGAGALLVGGAAAAIGVPLGRHLLEANGRFVFPAGTATELRVAGGAGALLAVSAAAAVGVAMTVRRTAGAVAAALGFLVLPYVVGVSVSGAVGEWLFRVTPAAGFALFGTLPHAAQVAYPYTVANGYYPLSPFVGLAVLAAWGAAALGLAGYLLRRRDV